MVTVAESGLISLIEPILNPVWVVIVAHERPSNPTIVGGMFLLAGVASRYLPFGPAGSGVQPEAVSAAFEGDPPVSAG